MKTAAFQELLESARAAGAYLKGNRETVTRTDRISAGSRRGQPQNHEPHNPGLNLGIADKAHIERDALRPDLFQIS